MYICLHTATRVDEEMNSVLVQNVLPALPEAEDEPGTKETIGEGECIFL